VRFDAAFSVLGGRAAGDEDAASGDIEVGTLCVTGVRTVDGVLSVRARKGMTGVQLLLRSWVRAAALIAVVGSGPAAVALPSTAFAAARLGSPAVKDCGTGPALVRPSSMILTCADDGELAGHLTWLSWTPARATATGTVTWHVCIPSCAASKRWEHTSADLTLTGPMSKPGQRSLFTKLVLQVTGRTPRGFMREVTFSEAPAATPPPRFHRPGIRPPGTHRPQPSAPSGSLGYGQIEGYWVYAGGATGSAGSYNDEQVAAAITGAESSFLPGNIQPGVDYCGPGADRAGWGLWQITCGNSVPQYGTDFQILDPWNNAEEAVYKYRQAGGFSPWATYTSGAYAAYLQHTSADMDITDPGEYVQYHSTPPGTPSSPSPNPGSKYGTLIPFDVFNYNSGLCLGISGDANDQPAVQWGCNVNADQRWHWGSQNSSYPGWYQLVNANGSCLGITGGSLNQGAQAVGWSCLGSSHYDQYWTPLPYSCNGYIPLEDLNSGYVLGVSGNSKTQGAAVVQWGYQGVCNNQFWNSP
jgi:hypothetical protein